MSRRRKTNSPARCGWCLSGKHLPTEGSRGCVRYRDPSSDAHRPDCPCDHESHQGAAT